MKRLLKLFSLDRTTAAPKKKKAAEAPAPIPSAASAPAPRTDDETLILITAALAAFGYSLSQIVSIRPLGVSGWMHAGRVETVQNRNRMFR